MPKGVPKRDGSGGGSRANRGRGGCKDPRDAGRGIGASVFLSNIYQILKRIHSSRKI